MSNIIEIKACPFCGSLKVWICRTNEYACWVRCGECGADAPSAAKREDAIDIWNTRPDIDWPAEITQDDEKEK
jgi:Lar family restriction alleviation protein